jgi:hypothetical protein
MSLQNISATARHDRRSGAGLPRAFVESADPVVRQFIDGGADGPLPVW